MAAVFDLAKTRIGNKRDQVNNFILIAITNTHINLYLAKWEWNAVKIFLLLLIISLFINQVEDALRDRVDKFETKVGHDDDDDGSDDEDDDGDVDTW